MAINHHNRLATCSLVARRGLKQNYNDKPQIIRTNMSEKAPINIVKKPLKPKKLQEMAKNGRIKAVVSISFDDLLENDKNWLIEESGEIIAEDSEALEDAELKPVAIKGGNVLIEISANIESFLERQSQSQEQEA